MQVGPVLGPASEWQYQRCSKIGPTCIAVHMESFDVAIVYWRVDCL